MRCVVRCVLCCAIMVACNRLPVAGACLSFFVFCRLSLRVRCLLAAVCSCACLFAVLVFGLVCVEFADCCLLLSVVCCALVVVCCVVCCLLFFGC